MLTKLLKYDLKPVIKIAAFFGISILVCTLLERITNYGYTEVTNENGVTISLAPNAPETQQAIHTLFYCLVGILGITFIIMMVLNTWKSFYKSFYSDTAYLTHTLPISRRTLWISKILTTLITNFILVSIIVIICCITQAVSGDLITSIFGWQYNAPFAYYLGLVVGMFTSLNIITLCGIVGMVLGYHMPRKQVAFSIVWSCLLALGIIIIVGWISDIWTGLNWNHSSHYINFLGFPSHAGSFNNATYALQHIIGMLVVNLCTIAALYYIGDRSLQKGINLD